MTQFERQQQNHIPSNIDARFEMLLRKYLPTWLVRILILEKRRGIPTSGLKKNALAYLLMVAVIVALIIVLIL